MHEGSVISLEILQTAEEIKAKQKQQIRSKYMAKLGIGHTISD